MSYSTEALSSNEIDSISRNMYESDSDSYYLYDNDEEEESE